MRGNSGNKKAHGHRGYHFKFNNNGELLKFVLLYKDLFVPYSNYQIQTQARVYTNNYHDWHVDENAVKMMEQGYRIYKGNNVTVNLKKEGFEEIISSDLFEKIRIRTGIFAYKMKAA